MQITRHDEAKPYEAPLHYGVRGLRLQGFDATDTDAFWVGLSYFEPGGGADMAATPMEKVYFVLKGEITVVTEDGEEVLGPLDSCHLEFNEARAVENRSDSETQMLVLMTYPPAS